MNLGIDMHRREPWVVVTPLGDLDMGSAPSLRQQLVNLITGGDCLVVLDLGSVDFVDSIGIGVIIGALRRARARGGDLVLARPSAEFASLLALVDLDRVFTVHADIDAAAAEAQPPS